MLCPFPGLRSYRMDEADWFFGREGKSDAMAEKLSRRRFLAVVGESGSGKSSLVRAGLLPTLEAGLLAQAGAEWQVVDMHPARDPVGRLSAALIGAGFVQGSSREVLERDPAAIAAARKLNDKARGNLLILADQFEELFRYSSHRDEKAAFVQLLLEAARQREVPVYVVITVRSDFLGECSQFRGLPEEINEGQYLVPRMTRENVREAIEGPIRLAGAEIDPRLVQILLDEAGSEPDQLPVLQHALMRTWNNWVERNNPADPVREDPDFVKTGRLQNALSLHADEALEDARKSLGPDAAETLARAVFTLLRDRDANGREVRRPTRIHEMHEVTSTSASDIRLLLEEFRKPGRTFLTASREAAPGEDCEDVEYDVTHESFLRKWKRLRDEWTPAEVASRRIYLRLVQQSLDSDPKNPSYMDGTVLDQTLEWAEPKAGSKNARPTAAWAARYAREFADPPPNLFENAMAFLADSRANREARRSADKLAAETAADAARAKAEADLARERYARATARKRAAYAVIVLASVGLGALFLFWRDARREKDHATVLAIASRAQLAAQNPEQLDRSALLAAESLRREPTVEAQTLLIRSLDLLPRSLPDLVQQDARHLSYSPDGKRIATADNSGVVTVWNADTATVVKTLKAPANLTELWMLNDQVLTAHKEGPPQLFNLGDGHATPLGCATSLLDISPDGRQVLVECDKEESLVLWTLESPPRIAARIRPHNSVRAFAVSNRGKWVAIGSADKLELYSVPEHRFGESDKLDVSLVALNFDDEEQVIGVTADGRVRTWSASDLSDSDENPLSGFGTEEVSDAAIFGAQGLVVASGPSRAVGLWQVNGDRLAMGTSSAPIADVGVTEGEFCALSRDGRLRRWRLPASISGASSAGGFMPSRAVGFFSPDGKWLITRLGAKTWTIQHAWSGTVTMRNEKRPYYPVILDPTGKYMAVRVNTPHAGQPPWPNTLEIRGFENGRIGDEVLGRVTLLLSQGGTTGFAKFSPDGSRVMQLHRASTRDPYLLTVSDWKTGKTLGERAIDRSALAFFRPDGNAVLWDLKDTLSRWTFADDQVQTVPLPIAGRRTSWTTLPAKGLAACSITGPRKSGPAADTDDDEEDSQTTGNQVLVCTYPKWSVLARLDHPDSVTSTAFSGDGARLLSVTRDGTIRLWDWKNQQQLAMIPAPSRVAAMALLDDKRVAALENGRLKTYSWQLDELQREICDRVRNNLTQAEWKGFQLEEREFPRTKLCPGLP